MQSIFVYTYSFLAYVRTTWRMRNLFSTLAISSGELAQLWDRRPYSSKTRMNYNQFEYES